MITPPLVIAFDVVETLFSLESLGERFTQAGLPTEALQIFFAHLLRDAFALEASGSYVPFHEVANASLKIVASDFGAVFGEADIANILSAFAELSAHPDVRPAFEQVQRAGVRTVALTNGSAQTTRKLIDKAGLSPFVEKILSIDDVRHWKPNREVYLYAARATGVDPSRVALVAAHAWDTHGAKGAGLLTGWVQRRETDYSSAMAAPDVRGRTLTEVVGKLLAPEN